MNMVFKDTFNNIPAISWRISCTMEVYMPFCNMSNYNIISVKLTLVLAQKYLNQYLRNNSWKPHCEKIEKGNQD